MDHLCCKARKLAIEWLILLLVVFGTQCVRANNGWLQLTIPGQIRQEELSDWHTLSLKEGFLVIEQAGTSISLDTLVLMKIYDSPQQLTSGRFPGHVTAGILREGWTASSKIGKRKWDFSVTHERRPDGKLLAGSIEILATSGPSNASTKVLLPRAGGMAFTRQELLWLGDMNNDSEPDLLLKRTWVTGEIDFVMVVSSMGLATAYFDPDRPIYYFSSGVGMEDEELQEHKDRRPMQAPPEFINKGSFSIRDEVWWKLVAEAALLPKVLDDRQFELDGENIRFTLEYLPRAKEGLSSTNHYHWDGNVLVKVFFRGRSQVLMQAASPDGDPFSLFIGLVNGKLGIKINYQPHYNNMFTRYWIFDEVEKHFRRFSIYHEQGC
jgi:hypothetical protein